MTATALPRAAGRTAVGDIDVQWLPEVVDKPYAATFLFPDYARAAVDRHLDWLAPRFFDAAAEQFILNTHSYVIRTRRRTIVVDTCLGNDKVRRRYAHLDRRRAPYLDDLRTMGVDPAAVDVVLCTHLHIDHVGWNTRLENGRWVATFPNARYLFSRTEYEHAAREAKDQPQHSDGSFEDSVVPIVEAGKAEMIVGTHTIDDGLNVEPAPGHTPGHVALALASRGARAILTGDIVHNPVQYALPDWNSTFCLDAIRARQTRRALIERCADTGTLVLPAHFPAPTAGRIVSAHGAFKFDAVG
jgi:glyoxylase-like metal-dependent hydrolase (beta-lactamase superfamily II)